MHRVYIYQLTDDTKMHELVDFSHELDLECLKYRCSPDRVCIRVPVNRLKLFLIKFSKCVNLIDKTWEIE